MNLEMELHGLPHCPRNRSHTILRKGKASFLGKTEAARAYEAAILIDLKPYIEAAARFKLAFDSTKHYLSAKWTFYSPDVMTKDGRVSMNGTDLDAHKVLQDTVMKFLGVDDAFICYDVRKKLQGDYKVVMHFVIEEICNG